MEPKNLTIDETIAYVTIGFVIVNLIAMMRFGWFTGVM